MQKGNEQVLRDSVLRGSRKAGRKLKTGVGKSFYTEGWVPAPKPCTVWLPPLCWLQGLEPEQKPRGDKKVCGQDSENPGSFLLLTPRKPIGRPPDSGIVSHSGEVQRTHLWRN